VTSNGGAAARGLIVERVEIGIPLDPFLSLKALAAYSSLSTRTLRGYIELPPDQALPCYRPPGGGKMLVRRSVFDQWLERYRACGRPSLVKAMRELGLPT